MPQVKQFFPGRDVDLYTYCVGLQGDKIKFEFGPYASFGTVNFLLVPALEPDPFLGMRNNTSLCADECVGSREVTTSMDSENTWDLMEEWYLQCLRNHQRCDRIQSAGVLVYPRRLLDVGDPTLGDNVCLYITSDNEVCRSYMTLSHRWNENVERIARTLQEDLNAMTKVISLDLLTQTFKDAIRITRRFQVRYLWIDALCILQNDPDDLKRELEVMGKIYQNAVCNLSAGSASTDMQIGMFAARDSATIQPYRVYKGWDVSAMKDNFHRRITRPSGPYYVVEQDFILDKLFRAPINQRAWVVQERILSPRTLHFGPQQLFWECKDHIACETFPKGIPNLICKGVREPDTSIFHTGSGAKFSERYCFMIWKETVEFYSGCIMTKDTDKLIALSGLAREMYNSINHQAYLAGLWENDLIESLLWRVKDGKQGDGSHASRIGSYQAPTWSWASIHGAVERGDNTDSLGDGTEPLISILDASVTPADKEDPWGAIAAAVVKVRGRIIPGRAISWESWKTDDDHGSGRSQLNADVNIGDLVPHSKRGLGRRHVICNVDDRREFEHLRNPRSTRLLALLPIVRAEQRTAAVHWTAEFEGLIIANTSVPGLYTRVGQFGAHALGIVGEPLPDLQTAIEDLEEVEIRLV